MSRINYTPKFYIRLFWAIIIVPIVTLFLIFILISSGKLGEIPKFEDLENPENNLASEIYSEDGVIIGTYYYENRSFVGFDELSPDLINALIATEDIRFHKHAGVDLRGLGRVFVYTILLGDKNSGGGSTITQQLAKNLFPRDTTSYNFFLRRKVHLGVNKFKEWVTSVKLEKNYTKEELLVMYFNTVPFGGQSFGIKSAAKTYFNVSPDSLKVQDAALLVGLLKAPTFFSPVRNPERSLLRRNVVLSQMNKYGYISNSEFDSLSILPIELNYQIQDHNFGTATYFREYIRLSLNASIPKRKNYFLYDDFKNDSIRWETDPIYGWCSKNRKPDSTTYNLYKDGLKVYTTIDSRMQRYAEEAVYEHLGSDVQRDFENEQENNPNAPYYEKLSNSELRDILDLAMRRTERYRMMRRAGTNPDSIQIAFNTPVPMTVFSWKGDRDTIMTPMDSLIYYKFYLRGSFVAVDPHNGYIKAYVGGPDFRHFKYDMVSLGKRQVGSTIKPFLYTLAMQEGYSPCNTVPNVPTTFILPNDSTWTPKNSGPSSKDGQMVTLKWGLANSVNYISAWLIKQFNPESVIDVMKKMGVTSKIDAVPSIFLGTSDITLLEVVSAYSTFSNKGVHAEPLFISRIEDKNGNVLARFTSTKNEAISEQTAYLMTYLLQGVVKEGTAGRLRWYYELMNEIGGKTGTTQNQSDGWFIGITPNLVSGAWVGGEDRSIHFKGLGLGAGGSTSLPIFGLFMQKVYNDTSLFVSPDDIFEKPFNFNVDINCDSDTPNEGEQNYNEDNTDFF
ncbi:MAG: penicillin-binding protein [Bacteroidetes bacterium GWA2_31_9b]|nr:MAG: penicillin-binding protein [Bacteroidetes bacterium GWA2_31_9b]